MSKTTPKTSSGQLVKAFARDLRLAPRKIRLVTNLIKGLSVNDAMVELQHLNKKGAVMVAKLLKSAVANARNNFSLDENNLYIKSISADMGTVMKRYFPRARGSAFVIRRKLSHVNLVLEERKSGKASKKNKFSLFKPEIKDDQAETSVDQKQQTAIKPESDQPKKQKLFKTDEQIKMNKVQNKRRLFNRKSGE